MSLPAVYNQKFIDAINSTQQPYLDTQNYGITITPVADPSQPHWRIVGIHHLTGPENHGQHHLFVEVLNDQGERIQNSQVTVRRNDQPPALLTLDKPAHEPGTNTHMHFNDNLSITVNWEGLPSETAFGFHTRHDDDDPPGTTRGHHSYYIVFQKSAGVTDQPSDPTDDGIGVSPPADGSDLEAELWAVGHPLIQSFNREAALYQKAQDLGLGEHLTSEYEVMHEGQTYLAQIFELGMVYALAGQWDQVQVVETATRDVARAALPPIFWDNHITGFSGNRGQYWEWYLKGQVPGLEWEYFKDEAVTQNPALRDDGWVFKADKVYKMPRGEGQPAASATAPVTMPALPPPTVAPSPVGPAVNGARIAVHVPPSRFVQARGRHFYLNNEPKRFIGVNIRGLVHYGQDPAYFKDAPVEHRAIQLQAAQDMNARLVRAFLAHKDATPQEIERRLRDTINLIKSQFPDIYLLPAFTNLYKDVPFYVKGDEGFYEGILNHAFYSGGYRENYLPFVKHIVTAFKDEPQIFGWEIGNELKAENAPDLLATFMTDVAAEIKALDPNHMVTTGMISTRHAFMAPEPQLRDKLYGSNAIDFITIHPYNGNEHPPEINDDRDLAQKFDKPLMVEEAGFSREIYANRPEKTRADMAYWFGEEASCYMPWGFVATDFDNNDGDGIIGMTGPLHADFPELYELHRKCGHILLNSQIDVDVRHSIQNIDYSVVRDLLPDLPWPTMVDGFDFPVGRPNGADYYVAAGLVDPHYHAKYDVWHPGEDWNGVGGGDSDLGDPVYAVAHGLVITAYSFETWGNVVLLEHVLPTGEKVWSQYAHLNDMVVNKGDIVRRGEVIGTIGKGGDHRFVAHLHFEIRLRNLPASKWGWKTAEDREKVLRYYAHPTNFIKSYRPR